MSKYFKSGFFWNEETKNSLGLPRPGLRVPKEFWFFKNHRLPLKNDFFIHKLIPIPWQSRPVFNEKKQAFSVIEENEKLVYLNKICAYCAVPFLEDEQCTRWSGADLTESPNDGQGPRVFSDTYPFHIECMKQARIFCPFMRFKEDGEFEHGRFIDLEKKAIEFKKMFLL
jgi:hypothetical protein